MTKLNKFEQHIILEGLKMYSTSMKKEIKKATKAGKNHIFTEGFVDLTSNEIEQKLNTLTLK